MKTRSATALAEHSIIANDYAEEVSGVRHAPLRDPEVGVAIEAFAADRDLDDPTPVYARPYTVVGGERRDFERDYFLGTRFETGLIEGATWEDEMRADGASDSAIAQCRIYVREHAI